MSPLPKVLHLNNGYGVGGAGIAGTRIYEELHAHYDLNMRYVCVQPAIKGTRADIVNPYIADKEQAEMFRDPASESAAPVEHSPRHEPSQETLQKKFARSKLGNYIRHVRDALFGEPSQPKHGTLFRADMQDVNQKMIDCILDFSPDIIHLHWIDLMISFKALHTIAHTIGAKVVWTTHDMWPYTGGCHYNLVPGHYSNTIQFCDKWKVHCNNCPSLHGRVKQDPSYMFFEARTQYLNPLGVYFVCPAQWAQQDIDQSPILRNCKSYHIPNPYNTTVFRPLDKVTCRTQLKLPLNKKLLLFGDVYSRLKGGYLLNSALQKARVAQDELALVGFGSTNIVTSKKYEIINLGHIASESLLAKVYSACDVMAIPSVKEIGPSTAIEAMLCGLPVLGFAAFGLQEFVQHKQNGYLVTPYETEDFARGLEFLLSQDEHVYRAYSQSARTRTTSIFNKERIVRKYYDVYQEVMQDKMNNRT